MNLDIYKSFRHRHCPNGNFGDKLTEFFLKKMFPDITLGFHSMRHASFVGVGSILHHVPWDYGGIIWTPGLAFQENKGIFMKAKVIAVRGQESLKRIDCNHKDEVILGDGGLICNLFAHNVPKKYKLGLVPHYWDRPHYMVKKLSLSKYVKFIDVNDDCQDIINQISECDYILSSSLHGLVAADSLGIPNRWIKLSEKIGGNTFKLKDYYSAFGIINKEPWIIRDDDTLDSLIDKLENRKYVRPNLEKIQKNLIVSLKEVLS